MKKKSEKVEENRFMGVASEQWNWWGDVGLVLLFSLILSYYFQFQSQYIAGADGFYHIKAAWILRTEGFLRQFPWASLSLWRDHFSDKEFLYHIFLMPFTYFSDLQWGAKIATVLLTSIALTSFYVVLRLNKISWSLMWFLLLVSSGGYFLYRANVVRPQVLSIILVIWSIHFIINDKRVPLAILGFFYCTAYTAYMLPFIFSLIYSGHLLVWEKKLEWKTPLTALGAMAAGMIIHPFFPNNLRMFYLQNFYVLWMGTNSSVNLRMGSEFAPMNTWKMINVNMSTWIPYLAVFFSALHFKIPVNSKTKGLFWISLALLFLTFMSKRFGEYSIPVTLMFCAFYFSDTLEKFDVKKSFQQKPLWTAFLLNTGAVLLVVLAILSRADVAPQLAVKESSYKAAALYLKEHTKKDERVYTCDWDDAPELWFYNSDNRYLLFLDPNFLYFWDAKLWQMWDNLSAGRFGDSTLNVFKREFSDITYGVCTSNFSTLRTIIDRDPRMEVVLDSGGVYVFKIK